MLIRKGFEVREAHGLPEPLEEELNAYFSGEPTVFKTRIWFAWGTPFQKAVWEAMRTIPYGQTRSYSWIARRIGKPRAARAVGNAVKANPLFLLVPVSYTHLTLPTTERV